MNREEIGRLAADLRKAEDAQDKAWQDCRRAERALRDQKVVHREREYLLEDEVRKANEELEDFRYGVKAVNEE
jgi:hypothetical protein